MTEWMYEHEGLHVRVSTTGSQARIEWKGVSDSRSCMTGCNRPRIRCSVRNAKPNCT